MLYAALPILIRVKMNPTLSALLSKTQFQQQVLNTQIGMNYVGCFQDTETQVPGKQHFTHCGSMS